jgi:branched-subunit amino acid transport protein
MAHMTGLGGGWWPYVFIAVAGFAATDFWRFLGVGMAARIDETSALLRWVKAVATALVAGLVARLIIFPVGDLASSSLAERLGAVAVGLIVFYAARRNMLAGILAGELALLAAMWAGIG